MKLITTSREGGKWQEREFVFAGGIKSGIPLVIVDETKTYQTHMGFGAAFTEAAALTLLGRVSGKNVRVRMDGGELTVDAEEKDGSIENLYLTGPAAMVCAGEILDEAILKLVKRQEEKT